MYIHYTILHDLRYSTFHTIPCCFSLFHTKFFHGQIQIYIDILLKLCTISNIQADTRYTIVLYA